MRLALFGGRLDDLGEVASFQTCASDQGPIDVGLRKEFPGILALDGSAIQNTDYPGERFAQDLRHGRPDFNGGSPSSSRAASGMLPSTV